MWLISTCIIFSNWKWYNFILLSVLSCINNFFLRKNTNLLAILWISVNLFFIPLLFWPVKIEVGINTFGKRKPYNLISHIFLFDLNITCLLLSLLINSIFGRSRILKFLPKFQLFFLEGKIFSVVKNCCSQKLYIYCVDKCYTSYSTSLLENGSLLTE